MTLNNNSVLPTEILHQIFKSLEPKQRFCQIPSVCSNWNKACQSQLLPIEVELSIHFSLFERYFFQNSVRTSQIQFNESLNTIKTLPCKITENENSEELETLYGKCKTEIKYQPIIFKKVRSEGNVKVITKDNSCFKVKDLLQESLKKKWNSLSQGKDVPNRNLIPVFKNVQFYVESPALWFDPNKCNYFLPVVHEVFYSISPYAPERLDVGLISLPILYQIPLNIKHLTLCLLMRDYGKAMKYICNNFKHLESLDLTIKSNNVFTPELNDIITSKSISNKIQINSEFKNSDMFAHQYNMSYLSANTNDILIEPEKFRDLVKLKNLQKFSIHNPVKQISNVKLMYNVLSTAKSLKELSFSPRLLLTRVDDKHLISMIHSLVKLYHLDFENPYIELWNLIKTCKNITELSLNYTHSYLTTLVREAFIESGRNSTINVNDNTDTSIALVTSPTTRENRFNELFNNRLNRNNVNIMRATNNGINNNDSNNNSNDDNNNNQSQQDSQVSEDYFKKSIHGIADCFPNLEKLQISWQATKSFSNHDYTISIQKVVESLVYLKNKTKLKSITMLYKDPKLVSKLEKALGKNVEINKYK
jgi:hypothetical protein